MAAIPIPKSADQESWPTTKAKVISSQYEYAKWKDVDFETPSDRSYFLVTFSYTVNGEYFVDAFEAQSDYEEGHEFEIGYDPAHPQSNTYSTPPKSTRSKVITWVGGIALAALLIYLQRKFGWAGE